MLSGGDYDGDEFLVLKSSAKLDAGDGGPPMSLVDAFEGANSEPWSEPPPDPDAKAPPPKCVTDDVVQVAADLREDFLNLNAVAGTIGAIAVILLMAQEK